MKTRTMGVFFGALVIAAFTLSAQAAAGNGKMSDRAREALANNPNDWVNLIVTYKQRPTAGDRGKVAQAGGQLRHEFRLIDGHAVTVPAQAAAALENNPNVARIDFDERVVSTLVSTEEDGLYTINPASVAVTASLPSSVISHHPALGSSVPYTGAGVKVAVVDSGYKNHGDLNPSFKVSLVGNKADDENGHGNHVSAIVVGDGSDSSGLYRGIAPDAELITVRVLDDEAPSDRPALPVRTDSTGPVAPRPASSRLPPPPYDRHRR